MAVFKKIIAATMATDGSQTSAFEIPGDFSHFMVKIPISSGWCITATCGINILAADAADGDFYEVAYSNNPATTSSGHAVWSTAGSAAVSGANIICEALQFAPGYAKIRGLNTATAAAEFVVYGRKFD